MAEGRQTKPRTSLQYGDGLLQCLEIISGLLNYRVSAQSLKAGLPIGPSGFAPHLLLRAAERFNFKSRIVEKPFRQISSLYLPCILMLRGGKSCVLVALNRESATIYLPEDKKKPRTVHASKLEELYTGKVILIAHKPL